MSHSVFLSDFRSITPRFRGKQQDILEWLASAHAKAELMRQSEISPEERESLERRTKKIVMRYGCSTDRVEFRSSALEDYTLKDWEKMRIFSLDFKPEGKSATERSHFYAEVVDDIFRRFYVEEQAAPDSLIHVTCTGYISPSGAQKVVGLKNWGEHTTVAHAYHMGCYAALPAIRMAQGFTAAGLNRVDIVHTELCTLHLNPTERLPQQLVVQTLFADGFIRYSARPVLPPEHRMGLELFALHEEIIPESENCMTWMAAEHGMDMTLSRDVPDRIGTELKGFLERLTEKTGMRLGYFLERAQFAIHPGGPKIIDQVQALLNLRDDQVAASNCILREHGNMSSATLPHIWKHIIEDSTIASGTCIISLAFGPGLTISGGIFRKIAA